jgi:soluble lytic murein transglycosylase-like protein
VSVLQYLLRRSGAAVRVDGCFGRHTQRALRRFQRAHNLGVDGVAGRQTFRALTRNAPRFVPAAAHIGTSSSQVRGMIDYWAAHYGVDPALMRAVGWMESGYQPNLESSAGAWGVMQILPSTWSYVEQILLGRSVRRTASGNIRVGTALMRELLREFHGDVRLALAGWYQGPASVRRLGPFEVTRLFVADVLALRQRFG